MNRVVDFWDDVAFDMFVIFCWMALCGLVLIVLALFLGPSSARAGCAVFGAVLVAPVMIHGTLLTLWHWKSRYRGKHSKLWGALLLLETSGWLRLVYLLRHVVADRRNRGRYREAGTVRSQGTSLEASSQEPAPS